MIGKVTRRNEKGISLLMWSVFFFFLNFASDYQQDFFKLHSILYIIIYVPDINLKAL